MNKVFLTLFYCGLSPKAPGTIGSFVALLIAVILLQYISVSNLFMLCILITIISVQQIDLYEKKVKIHDSKEIVIDELVGMWLTLSIANVNNENILYIAPIGFIFFRIFDIWKPSIIGKIDKNIKGGWGVMGDDIVAGVAAGIATAATYQLLEKFIL